MARLTILTLLLLPSLALPQADADRRLKEAGVCARCHVISVLEWGHSRHPNIGVGCVECHGASKGHVIDERNNVKPDRIPRGAEVTALCKGCHQNPCPRTKQASDCQNCHHPHALIDPAKPPAPAGKGVAEAAARADRYALRMREGEQYAAAGKWEPARAAFHSALGEAPGDRTAQRRLRMCERRLAPRLPGFEIVGGEFDAETGLPRVVRLTGVDVEMVLVPGGDVEIGSDQLGGAKPVHTVRVEPFYLARTEVTQALWKSVTGTNPSDHQGKDFPDADRLPVEQVSWQDAHAFVTKLSEKVEGGGLRLPTEAEWESAARAGGGADEVLGAAKPRAVGLGRSGRLGLFDMQGNVREWCSSLARPYPYDVGDGRESASEDGLRILRGSAYIEPSGWFDPAARHGERPGRRLRWNGVRLARGVPEAK
jgi:formylglycine-generating enzyme required for sulfatase activity